MRDKKHGIKYPCDICEGAGWIVHQDPTKELDVLPITKKMKKKAKEPEVVVQEPVATE